MAVNKQEFEIVAQELDAGDPLTFTKIARVFGPEAYEIILLALMSAEQASSVIREAIQAVGKEEDVSGN